MKGMLKNERPHVMVTVLLTLLFIISLFIGTSAIRARSAQQQGVAATTNYANLVDPFTGTGTQPVIPYGSGNTFPGADVPFGMTQWSPDTVKAVPGGYNYKDNSIKGFSLTHLSGAGCPTYGDISFMPYVGAVTNSPASASAKYVSAFSHSDESARAGYYKVKLGNGVTTELTATQRSGEARFTYPAAQTATLLVNVSGSARGNTKAEATISGNTIAGSATSTVLCGSKSYTVYFWASFSQAFASYGTWQNNNVTFNNTVSGLGSGAYVTFDTSPSTVITARVGISFVSIANAQTNAQTENATSNFDTVLSQATQTWNNYLGKIQVGGGKASEVATFYTAMYHSLLQPNVFSDVNGDYEGFDGKVHSVQSGHAQYANYSGWDIYRSEAQLLALLAPNQASDIAQSMINDYAQSGLLPKWSQSNRETYIMVGDPAAPILADIYAFGGRNFDTQAALAALIHEATQTNNNRPGLNYLQDKGYLPLDGSYGCCKYYGAEAATTLEYNTADFSVGIFAKALGDTSNYQKFVDRAQGWRNLLNPTDKYLEPRRLDGSFPSGYNPNSEAYWLEGDGSQYTWMVPFNLKDLFSGLGGNSAVVSRRDTFFTELNGSAPYASLSNEPTTETPWEYDYAGAPYKTQEVVRRVENTLYHTGPLGLAGNDDLGQTSSWYVFAALGMFPETPGTADVVLSSPLFPSITISRPGGQTIHINAPGASATTYYVQSLKVNGSESTKPWLPASFITNGGTLDFTLSTTANTTWGAAPSDAPPSYGSATGGGGSFSTGFEGSDPQPSAINTVVTNGGLKNVTGICCAQSGPEAVSRTETAHNSKTALLYSGRVTNATAADYAYMEVFSGQSIKVGPATTLSYWIYPQSSSVNSLVSGTNSTCVALDLVFNDGTTLRNSGAVDQNNNRAHPAYQCNHLTLDTWNNVTVKLGAVANGKTVIQINEGYDQSNRAGGYRGYIDDIHIA